MQLEIAISTLPRTQRPLLPPTIKKAQAIPGFFEIEGTFEPPPLGPRVFRSAGAGSSS